MSDRREHSRRSILRTAGSVALGAVGTAGAAAACDGRTETTVETGSLSGATDARTLTHTAELAEPCELVFALASDEATDFDLYVTLDGRTPSTDDFDRKSETSFTSGETVTLEGDALSGADTFGVLVDSYTAGGSYRLEITETASGDGEQPNQPPTADFAVSPAAPVVGEAVTLEADATDPDGSIASYDWDLGDGTTASGRTATTTYDAEDEYTVSLTVTDDDGGTDTATRTITVERDDDGGQCDRTLTRTETGTLSGTGDDDAYTYATRTAEPCDLTLSLSGDAGTDFDLYLTYDGRTPTTRNWDERSYNYGSDEEIVADPDQLAGDAEFGVLVNSYDGAGDYELVFEEVGGGGEAPNEGPTARIDVSPAEPVAGEAITFDGTGSSDPDGTIASYEWTLDGEVVSTEPSDTFTLDAGEYTAELTVTDDEGASDSTAATLTVAPDDGGNCGAERETASTSDRLYGIFGGDTYTYDTSTATPCRATVTLDGPAGADFDLYVTLDGRTPTRDDYDERSAGPGADEELVLTDVDAGTSVGILVDPASGYGEYIIAVEELGA
jgi:chitodextrinase